MCLSIPGKVVEIGEDKFIIDYGSEKRVVNMSLVEDLKIGDYVIINNKIILYKMSKTDAKKVLELIK
jgi:hydrogenase expression/formation protein HypC